MYSIDWGVSFTIRKGGAPPPPTPEPQPWSAIVGLLTFGNKNQVFAEGAEQTPN